ncbi:MAG: S-adenosylmethionine decarboxylase [Candidatus Kariarchaeaceae archaeon]|jgi:S-adenosylmethionine decarboxylase
MRKLRPEIFRQRLIIEAQLEKGFEITPMKMDTFLRELSRVLNMTLVEHSRNPDLRFVEEYGWAGYANWIESGVHMYTWKAKNFITIDIYTCKPFENEIAINLAKEMFAVDKDENDNLLLESIAI